MINRHYKLRPNEEAFQQYYRDFRHVFYKYTYQLILEAEVAKDIVSDAFSKCWERTEKYNTQPKMNAFMYTACRNSAYNFVKYGSGYRHKNEIPMEDLESLVRDQELKDQALKDLIIKEHIEEVRRAMKHLSPQEQSVIDMFYFQDMKIYEIADALSLNDPQVRVVKHNALVKLKKLCKCDLVFALAGLLLLI
ncbi:sigma-70 family RNA polymerase sigma factor [Paraflavitalea sp. CAU 1676]|uniref:RNA polymerase sigma factor n=1 Tax=Paraflavitalea sp. CAU 1676 TaxID=3032598 RepID=UPI0023DC2183|nr:sigma-70 family RNA polymerase sigma factor [Paraflavitalea sp. CAU 1676]MDF2189147.1 sigma-70 family RNA polymerase sigma factor [Paraflavitalea sp. CAU 1676]